MIDESKIKIECEKSALKNDSFELDSHRLSGRITTTEGGKLENILVTFSPN